MVKIVVISRFVFRALLEPTQLVSTSKNSKHLSNMTAVLPPNLLRLFEPRPPLPYFKPVRGDPTQVREKRPEAMSVSGLLEELREEQALKEAEKSAAYAANEKQQQQQSSKSTSVVRKSEVKDEEMDGTAADAGPQAKKEDGEEGEDDTEMGEVVEDDPPKPLAKAAAANGKVLEGSSISDALKQLDGVHVDDDGEQFTYTEAEKYRLRQIERKRLREENAKKAVQECE